MNILKFQLVNANDDEIDLVPEFINELYTNMFKFINNYVTRKKISIRLNYILDNVKWIQWTKSKYNTTVDDIIQAIFYSLDFDIQRNNTYNLKINTEVLIPNSNTSIDRLIRFIEYGDNKYKATGVFNKIKQAYDIFKLNNLWQMFILKKLHYNSNAQLVQK